MAMGLCACGSASDSLPVDASVTGTYDDQSSAVPASADTDTSSPETASPDTENTSPAGPLRDATPVCLVPQADGTAVVSNDVAVIDYLICPMASLCQLYRHLSQSQTAHHRSRHRCLYL